MNIIRIILSYYNIIMSDFYSKLESQSNLHHNVLHDQHMEMAHKHAIVKTYGNKNLNIKASQLPSADIHRNCNWWRYSSKSDLSSMISGAGQAHIQIDRGSGSGHIKAVWLRFQIYNGTGAGVDLVNMAHLISEIEFQTPSGQQIQVINGSDLWNIICRMYPVDEFSRIAKLINTNKYYGKGMTIANGETKTFYLPLLTCFLENSQFFVTAVDGDLNCFVRFRPSSATIVSGSAPTLQDLSLEVQMEQLPSPKRSGYIKKYKSTIHHFFVPYICRQVVSQTLSASTTYSINLSSIKGDIVWLDFFIRPSITGNALRNYSPVASFRLLNNEGDDLTGQNLITSDFNRYVQQLGYFPSNYSDYANIYSFVFSIDDHAPVNLILNGSKSGNYPFTTYERLEFTTTAAGVNEVWQIAPQGTPDDGAYCFVWVTPNSVEKTGTLSYDANAATQKAAIEALATFDGIITSSGVLTSSQTFTFSGNYGYQPLASRGYQLYVESLGAKTNADVAVFYTNGLQTAGQYGINSGASHTIEIVGYSTSLLSLLPNGQIEIRNT
jgi:hypothetical protein